MTSITSWIRLEPICRNDGITPGLDARIHDPLWFLARQWQLGEFTGDDAGTPVAIRVRGEAAKLDVFNTPFSVAIEAIDRDDLASTVKATDVRARIESGAQLLRMLAAAGLTRSRAQLLERYPLDPALDVVDERTRGLLAASIGRVADGRSAHDELAPLLANTETLPASFDIAASHRERTVQVLLAWLTWYGSTIVEPKRSAWKPDRLEYAFDTRIELADRELRLGAREYDGTGLDWHSFEILDDTTSSGATHPASSFVRTVQPMHARYRGMPASRYWELEDAAVDFGAIDARAGDISRLLLTEYALVYGDDWHLAPLQLDVGTACRIRSVVVTDSFGVRTLVPSYLDDPTSTRFRLFATQGAEDVLVIPDAPRFLESAAMEQVDFLRDEAANLVWGIERRIEAADGTFIDRTAAPYDPSPHPTSNILTYQLAQRPAPNWVPLKPTDAHGLELAPAVFAQRTAHTPLDSAQGALLHTPRIAEEEVPSEGIRIARTYRYARWFDGRSLLWIAYTKRPGGEPAVSNLRFDLALDPNR